MAAGNFDKEPSFTKPNGQGLNAAFSLALADHSFAAQTLRTNQYILLHIKVKFGASLHIIRATIFIAFPDSECVIKQTLIHAQFYHLIPVQEQTYLMNQKSEVSELCVIPSPLPSALRNHAASAISNAMSRRSAMARTAQLPLIRQLTNSVTSFELYMDGSAFIPHHHCRTDAPPPLADPESHSDHHHP